MSPGRVVISRCNNIDSASLGLLKFGSGIPISDEYTLCANSLPLHVNVDGLTILLSPASSY
ncbi:hypothetical protein OUZ56_004407 [Daphnia magna]|uniref:Uncharacterized protein n=1 Tax=Daphnia magna TaxID=35525 RepID=A0ABQ9YPP4_9CRUS|nr:hypothetical protein OUZ56_004407 [Daphnia magna]